MLVTGFLTTTTELLRKTSSRTQHSEIHSRHDCQSIQVITNVVPRDTFFYLINTPSLVDKNASTSKTSTKSALSPAQSV